MAAYRESGITVKGSDGNLYIVDTERVGRNTIELSLILGKVTINSDFPNLTTNIPNKLVENYIQKTKKTFGVQKEEAYSILDALTSATINNHFGYLKLLKELTPKFEKLLQ